jgi:hypothetical protein
MGGKKIHKPGPTENEFVILTAPNLMRASWTPCIKCFTTKILVFWDVMTCSPVDIHRCGITCYLHIQGSVHGFLHWRWRQQVPTTRCHIPEDRNLHHHCRDNLRSYTIYFFFRNNPLKGQENFLQIIQTSPGAHAVSYSTGTEGHIPRRSSNGSVKLATHLHLLHIPSWRVHEHRSQQS